MAREETRDLGLAGAGFAFGAFTLWGVLPAYWKALSNGLADPRTSALLVFSGVVTALPLIWFASAPKRLSFSTLGILQYSSPTLSFLLAVLVYDEPFTAVRAFAFACVWIAVGLYSVDLLRGSGARPGDVADAGT